jgi:hypothetical protein
LRRTAQAARWQTPAHKAIETSKMMLMIAVMLMWQQKQGQVEK